MATWNGARYIRQQLDSVFCQTFQDFQLIVRDDASSDSTLQIVEPYRSRYSGRVMVRKNQSRQGACRTFSLLAEESKAPYVAFCDQDDVWRSDKLELSCKAAKRVEAEHGIHTPVLVFSDMTLIGQDNELLAASMWKMKHVNPRRASLGTLLVQNIVSGCTVLANRSLIVRGIPIPEGAMMHDFWLGLVAAAFGILHPLNEPTVRYRQHQNNALGAGGSWRIADALKRWLSDPAFREGLEASRRQSRDFANRYANELSKRQKGILQTWSRSKELPAGIRHWTLYRNGLRRTSLLNNLGFLARV
jgi:glycosyltransferase involved in cell wall biosynthesis